MEGHAGPDNLDREAALVIAAQAGDRHAHKQLYLLHLGAVRSFVASRTVSSDVDDVTAETFARGFQELAKFTWQGISMRAWLMRIAQRELITRSRRRASSEVVSDDLEPGRVASHEEGIVNRMSATHQLGSALSRLTDRQQTVLRMRFVDDLAVAEVAAALGIGHDSVRALAYRGLCTLRSALDSDPGAPEPRD